MAKQDAWALPAELRPDPQALRYDFARAVRSVVLLRAEVPADAFTADALGTERLGNGVLIDIGGRPLILTIGYLIAEAETIWITTHKGRALPGHALAYDYTSGFGLVQPLASLDEPTLPRASAARLQTGDAVTLLAHGGVAHSLAAEVVGRREFAGYWEYLLEDAIYTSPAHPLWGGTALLDENGSLVALGSLLVQTENENESEQRAANLCVPLDVIEPLLGDLVSHGRRAGASRPWLGLYSTVQNEQVVVAGLLSTAPAHSAGVEPGDMVLEVGGRQIHTLPDFYRALWRQGDAGVTIPLTLQRGSRTLTLQVHSARREQFLKTPLHH